MKNNYFIKDPIHKEIIIRNNLIRDLIETKEFNRLRSIMQLGLSFKLFPSANHTRYSHSLGAYEVASKFISVFNETKKINIKDQELVQIAALLHDIGHGPLSHVFEKITPHKNKHEDWTIKIIKDESTEVNKVLKKYKVDINQIVSIINGTHKNKWMTQLISSDIDVDRIDYLLRDSYFVGTYFGTIDLDILLKRVKIIDNKLCFSENSTSLIRSFWYGRIHMNSDVYENKNLLVFEWILKLVFERLKEIKDILKNNKDKILFFNEYEWVITGKNIGVEEYLKLNDYNLFCFLDSLKKTNIDKQLTQLLNALDFGKGFSYISYEEFKLKKLDSKKNIYAYQVKEIGTKNLYSTNEKYNIYLYDENDNLIEFKNSSLKNSIKNTTDPKKIVLINEKIIV